MEITVEGAGGGDDLVRRYRAALSEIIRTAAFEVERLAVADAPVDTGFLKNTIHTVTSAGMFKNGQVQEIAATPKNAGPKYKPGELGKSGSVIARFESLYGRPPENVAEVVVGAAYGIYPEMGTYKMVAKPYMVPSADKVGSQMDVLIDETMKDHGL